MITGKKYLRWQDNWMRKMFSIYRIQHFIRYDNETYSFLDRRDKAMKMSDMLLTALQTSTNISTKLSMSLPDKYVPSIFAYDNAVWVLYVYWNTYNFLYIEKLPEGEGTRTAVTWVLRDCYGYTVPFSSPRRVRIKIPNSARRILISLSNMHDRDI